MTKREVIKNLKSNYVCLKRENSSHDLVLKRNNLEYKVLILSVSGNTQITINSKIVWELKKGRLNGIRFKGSFPVLHDLERFMQYENKVIIFTNKPYRVLKVINESEVEDISEDSKVYDTNLIYDLEKITDI